MFSMRADRVRSGISNAAQRALLRRATPPYLFLKKASRAAPIPDTQRRPTRSLRGNKLRNPKRVDCLGYFFVAGKDLAAQFHDCAHL